MYIYLYICIYVCIYLGLTLNRLGQNNETHTFNRHFGLNPDGISIRSFVFDAVLQVIPYCT